VGSGGVERETTVFASCDLAEEMNVGIWNSNGKEAEAWKAG
jgi:hypothetical protein